MPYTAANLNGWLNEPYVKNAVIAVLRRTEQSILLREVAAEADVPISSANRVLGRLHKRGMVTRYKLPMLSPMHCRPKVTPWLPFKATRMLYVYEWVDREA